MERGFRPRGPERRERRKGEEGVRGPEVRGSEEGVKGPEVRRITIEIGEKCYGFILPPEVFEKGGKVKVTTPEGVVFEVEVGPSEEFLKRVKEYQEKSEEHRKTTEEAVEALKEKLEVPPEILEKVKEIFGDVKSHLPEIPKILRELEEKLKELEEELEQVTSEEQRRKLENAIRGLENTKRYLTRLQEIAEQIEKETVPSNIIERLKEESFGQAREIIEEWFNNLKKDVYEGLELIFPDEKEREKFLDNLRQGLISPVHAVNIIARKFLEILKNSGIRVEKDLFEHWVKPLVTVIALYIVDRVLKDYREKLLQELENLEQQFNQADYQKLRELLRDLYERIEGESKNKLLKGLGIQKDGFDQFLNTLLKLLKNRELALRKIRYLIISALGIRAPKEIFEKINKKVKEIAELVYNKLRNFSTQQTETASGPVIGSRSMIEAIKKLLSEDPEQLEQNWKSYLELIENEIEEATSLKDLEEILGDLIVLIPKNKRKEFNSEEIMKTIEGGNEEEIKTKIRELVSNLQYVADEKKEDLTKRLISRIETLLASK